MSTGLTTCGWSRGLRTEPLKVDARIHLQLFGVNLENGNAPLSIGTVHKHLTIKTPGSQKRPIQDLRPVGRRHDHNAGAPIEAIHLDKQLVEGILALVKASHRGRIASPSVNMDLVPEDGSLHPGAWITHTPKTT